MKATLNHIEAAFDKYNDLCFNGSLPRVTLEISHARKTAGLFIYPSGRRADQRRGGMCRIRISDCLDMPEEEIDDVLIHEMIHYHIWLHAVDEPAHGPCFRAIMREINRRHGRHISVTFRMTQDKMDSDTRRRSNFILVADLDDGRRGFQLCSPSSTGTICRSLRKWGTVTRIAWYWSDDPWFNRFSVRRTARLYIMDEAAASAIQTRARPIRGPEL